MKTPDASTSPVTQPTDSVFATRKRFTLGLLLGLFSSGLSVAEPSRVTLAPLAEDAMVPDAEVDETGVIHVAYLARDNVYYTKSSNGGDSFSEPLRVNAEEGFASGGRFRGPDIAVGKDGRIHVVWYNAGYQQKRPKEEWGVMYSRLDAGSKRFDKVRNLNHKPSDNYSLAADDSGHVAVIWMAGGIFVNLSTDGGETFAAPVDLKLDPCECCGSRALYAQDGDLTVLYRDKTDDIRDAYLAQLPSGSQAVSSNLKISTTPWPIASCPMTGGFLSRSEIGLIAAWETKGEVYFASLRKEAAETMPTEIRATGKGRYPVALAAPDGSTLVAWKNGTLLEWQLFDEKNQPQGKRETVDGNNEHRPAGVVAQDGRFLLFP